VQAKGGSLLLPLVTKARSLRCMKREREGKLVNSEATSWRECFPLSLFVYLFGCDRQSIDRYIEDIAFC
jgi:hypothetical protein